MLSFDDIDRRYTYLQLSVYAAVELNLFPTFLRVDLLCIPSL